MTRLRTVRTESRGMSLVEILVTVFVLAVGLLAVIRILIPGLAVLPRTNMEAKAMQAASTLAREAETASDLRPDAIAYGVPINPQIAEAGWIVYHDVSMGDVDQIALARSAAGSLVPHYPNLVVGEIIEVPMQLQVAMLESGPYVQGTLKVYYPEPYTQLPSGSNPDDGDPDVNARTFEETGGVLTLDDHAGLPTIPGFVVCYSAIVGGILYDIVGEEIVPVGNAVDLSVSLAAIGGGTLVPNSVTLYEMAPNIVDDSLATSVDLGRGGFVQFSGSTPAPGTRLACIYEMLPHVRSGFDDISVTTFPEEQELRNVAVPDIQHYDTYVPLNGLDLDGDGTEDERRIKLPVETIVRTDADGNVVPLDATSAADENVRVVNRLTGTIGLPGGAVLDSGDAGSPTPGKDGFVRIDPASGDFPAGCPVRVYYRVPNNWSVERHVAAANYAFLDMNGIVYPTPTFVPESSRGLKQFWYTVAADAAGYWTLTFYNNPPGRAEERWDPVSPGPVVLPDEDGHRISVDYRYTDAAGDVQRVTGETHLVDFVSHGFTLHQPDVLAIDAVRGASYKVRVCFDGLDGQRRRVDVDTIVMR